MVIYILTILYTVALTFILRQLSSSASWCNPSSTRRSNRLCTLLYTHPCNARQGNDCYRSLAKLQIMSLVLTLCMN